MVCVPTEATMLGYVGAMEPADVGEPLGPYNAEAANGTGKTPPVPSDPQQVCRHTGSGMGSPHIKRTPNFENAIRSRHHGRYLCGHFDTCHQCTAQGGGGEHAEIGSISQSATASVARSRGYGTEIPGRPPGLTGSWI
jgi:hypothetical protein